MPSLLAPALSYFSAFYIIGCTKSVRLPSKIIFCQIIAEPCPAYAGIERNSMRIPLDCFTGYHRYPAIEVAIQHVSEAGRDT
jgi:hypothetical protein